MALTTAEKAALWDATTDMARIRGQVVLIDRWHDGALVAVGGERQTSDGRDMPEAVALAASRMGLDSAPRARATMATLDDIPRHTPLPDAEEGGPDD